MKLPSPDPGENADPILPLINVVFLLLIFFIMTGALYAVDLYDIAPPVSDSQAQGQLDNNIILVSADGRLALDNAEVAASDLQLAVTDRLAANADTVFRIKADGRADAARVVEVMELIEAVGVRRVILLTLGPAQ